MIKIRQLTHQYSSKTVFKEANLSLDSKSRVAVLGRNGAGKSTLLKILAGLIKPTAFDSMNFDDDIAYLPQGHQTDFFHGSVKDFLQLMNGRPSLESLPDELLDFRINDLSGGQRQLLFFESLLAMNRHIYLLDEPFVFLDPYYQLLMQKRLQEVESNNSLMLLVTHDLNFANSWASHFLIINDGKFELLPNNENALKELSEHYFCVSLKKQDSWSYTFHE